MISLVTREEARRVDANAIRRLRVPGLVLMENAGARAADAILDCYVRALSRVVIVMGTGQNGGDGAVVARQLISRGVAPEVVLVGRVSKISGDARTNYAALQAFGVRAHAWSANAKALVGRATLIVDALFGTGLDREVKGAYAQAIKAINASRAKVVALDLPSGVDANSGAVLGCAVRADLTVTFGAYKRGLTQYPARKLAGEVVVASIGVPCASTSSSIIASRDVSALVETRAPDAHKASVGHVLVVGGSPGKTGAALLCAQGAMRSGAGLVTIAARDEACRRALDAHVIEVMTELVAGDDRGALSAVLELLMRLRAKSCVVGPGLGRRARDVAFVRAFVKRVSLPSVLDADALFAFGDEPSLLARTASDFVLTPHPGEAARLLGTTNAAVQADRFTAAMTLAKTCKQVVVLKGASTIVAAPDGRTRVCMAGTPALATAGTGDVLAGAVGALLASGLTSFDAASAAVQLHAVAGELAALSDRGLLAHEVADALPRAFVEIRSNSDASGINAAR